MAARLDQLRLREEEGVQYVTPLGDAKRGPAEAGTAGRAQVDELEERAVGRRADARVERRDETSEKGAKVERSAENGERKRGGGR